MFRPKELLSERNEDAWTAANLKNTSGHLMEERKAVIKLEDGSLIKGKINILAEPAHEHCDTFLKHSEDRGAYFGRISDIFTKGKNPFIVVFDAVVEGQADRVLIINKNKILWISPED
ncbi:MAG: hypothetical protein WC405_19760 [Syntrophales bacterium]